MTRLALAYWADMPWDISQIIAPGALLWWLVWINFGLLVWRAAMKVKVVRRIYGTRHAVLSFPRFVVGNVINFTASTQAVAQFLTARFRKQPLRWLKTDHAYPNREALRVFRRRLGRLLVDREGLDEARVREALALQASSGVRLGEVMLHAGELDEDGLVRALGAQHAMSTLDPTTLDIPDAVFGRVEEALAVRLGVLPVGVDPDGAVRLAVARPLTAAERGELETALGAAVRSSIAASSAIESVRERIWRHLRLGATELPHGRLGDRLVQARQQLSARTVGLLPVPRCRRRGSPRGPRPPASRRPAAGADGAGRRRRPSVPRWSVRAEAWRAEVAELRAILVAQDAAAAAFVDWQPPASAAAWRNPAGSP